MKVEYDNLGNVKTIGGTLIQDGFSTLPIQNDEILQDIIAYIKNNEDFKITIEKLDD